MPLSRFVCLSLASALIAGCPSGDRLSNDDDAATDDDDAIVDPGTACDNMGYPRLAWDEGPYGDLRQDVADDFTIRRKGVEEWNFQTEFSGCDSYIFMMDNLTVSPNNDTPLIEVSDDLADLVRRSPPNVHYFFISTAGSGDAENEVTDALRARLDELLADWPDDIDEPAEHWAGRLHVSNDRLGKLDSWLDTALSTHGRRGVGIDRHQRVRGVGSLADVLRRDNSLDWPWENNIAYAAHEPQYYNYEAERLATLDAEKGVTIVTPWDGETLQEFADIDVDFPIAAEMATFDTLELDLTAFCPNEALLEAGNCGAWDYLAHVFVRDQADENWIEMARFITTYHRAGRYLVDATPALVELASGGTRRIRYSFAPSWNVQPTITKLDFRFSNRGKGHRPTESTFLFSGGNFNTDYNSNRDPIEVAVPASAVKVELVAIITGHGAADGNQCAEFCDHQHNFTVNGTEHRKTHPAIGNPLGCLETIGTGTVPNQSGTWWTGRGGWCPGRQVDPYVIDVTDLVPAGGTATIEYSALWDGRAPPPSGGNILMNSWLVIYE